MDNSNITFACGIDISKYQGNVVQKLDKAESGLSFIICKATEGITYTDPKFVTNWNQIKEKGFIRGAYHFYRTNDDPQQQANNFINAISSLTSQDIAPIIDFEEGSIVGNLSLQKIQDDLLNFLSIIEKTLGRKPIIYTDNNAGNLYLNSSSFAEYALWIANYSNKAQPTLPQTWENKTWSFWQKSDSYKIAGIVSDYDEYNGDLEALSTFIAEY